MPHNPFVPETLEGWSVLHLMHRLDWPRLRALPAADRRRLGGETAEALAATTAGHGDGATAWVRLLGHKADLMLVFFRRDFEALAHAELVLARSPLSDYCRPASSYVSVVELGMYEMTAKIHRELAARGLEEGSEAYEAAFDLEMARQRDRVASRLFVELPHRRYVCFYPMNKRRGDVLNWYTEPFERRAAMMLEHGKIGRHYAGQVTQVISGSIGFDDWEWGVDLFADDPLVFKKLIYEMRFDEASAKYAEFGPFYVGLQFGAAGLPDLLGGALPAL